MVTNAGQIDPGPLREATAHARAGRIDVAERLLAGFLADQLPVSMLCLRAELRAATGQDEAARADLEIARSRAPDDPRVADALAGQAMADGRLELAADLLDGALRQDPHRPRLWHRFGVVMHAAGRYQAALEAYERAMALAPSRPEPRIARASVWQIRGRFDEARKELEAVLAQVPGHPEALTTLAAQMEIRGRTEAGLALLEPLVRQGRLGPEGVLVRARLLRRAGRGDEALKLVEDLDASRLDAGQRARRLFLLGEIRDQAGRYEEAFTCFQCANELSPGRFDAARYRRRVEAVRRAWSRAALDRLAGLGDDSEAPVFIVGMPRSGTTLVEQTLARHPEVFGAGELGGIAGIERRLRGEGLSADPAAISAQTIQEHARAYLGSVDAGGRTRFIDKMPANFFHLGLIQVLLPRARVIHCRRHPLDTALSCFMQDFSGLGLAWSRRLEDIAEYYLGYRSLMDHWTSVLSLPVVDLDYEALVTEPEPTVRRLLEFLGLEWDPACLDTGGDEIPATASYAQAPGPIYLSSIGRHRLYADRLDPLAARLGIDPDET